MRLPIASNSNPFVHPSGIIVAVLPTEILPHHGEDVIQFSLSS
jgi:hypothetical protein